jgi:O-antigen/teichoic acid export membrane protein
MLLPIAARYLSDGSIDQLRRHVGAIVRMAAIILIAGTILAELGADIVVRAYLGASFEASTNILRLVMVGALPWGLVVTLQSVIDARHYRAVNTRNMAVAFGSLVLLVLAMRWFFGPTVWSDVSAFVISLYVVATLTVVEVLRITRSNATHTFLGGTDLTEVPVSTRRW